MKIPQAPDIFVPDRVRRAGFLFLPIELSHVLHLHNLPPIHKDPFDRLLISQSKTENLTLITSDAHFSRYKIKTLNFTDLS